MVRYTLLRILIFFGALLALSLIPALREDKFLLLLLAALVSAGVSFFVLSGMRDQWTAQWLAKREAKIAERESAGQRGVVGGTDESAEDAETDRRP